MKTMTAKNEASFLEAADLVKKHKNITKAARAAGVSRTTMQSRFERAVGLGMTGEPVTVPMSETTAKYMADWTPQDCVAELRRIAQIDEEKIISRNYFRNNAVCSESTWNRYFGTFEEFKRQAGLKLPRQVHHLEKNIAKHASVDHYRRMNIERMDYGDKYLRPSGDRFKTVLVASDLHDIECDPFFLRVLIDTAKRLQPDVICLNGDIFDLPEFGKYTVDPRDWNPVMRIQHVHKHVFAPLREACPDAQIDLIEGNHEFRLMRHLADQTPAMKAVLADLHGFTVAKLLQLDHFEINYIAKADLAAYTATNVREEVARNYRVYFDTMLAHHFPEGASLGLPGVNGHNHKWLVKSLYNETYRSYQWVQGGCGHIQDASYCNGEKWNLEFNVAHVDTQNKQVIWDCIPLTDFAVVGGQFYHRGEDEHVRVA